MPSGSAAAHRASPGRKALCRTTLRRRYSIVCGFKWSTVRLPGFSRIVRYTTIPSASALLVTPSDA